MLFDGILIADTMCALLSLRTTAWQSSSKVFVYKHTFLHCFLLSSLYSLFAHSFFLLSIAEIQKERTGARKKKLAHTFRWFLVARLKLK